MSTFAQAPSNKRWMNTKLNDDYAELLGAQLLTTVRETWAVAPSRHGAPVLAEDSKLGVSISPRLSSKCARVE